MPTFVAVAANTTALEIMLYQVNQVLNLKKNIVLGRYRYVPVPVHRKNPWCKCKSAGVNFDKINQFISRYYSLYNRLSKSAKFCY
jgi:hypothetical protein